MGNTNVSPLQIHTYLNFEGRCREAFAFYERHLGAKTTGMMTFSEGPEKETIPPESRDRVMHAGLEVDGYQIMGTDGLPEHAHGGITGMHLVIEVNDASEAERVFAALSENGRTEMAMQETFFAQRFGMAVDRFGVPWMVICSKERDR